MNDPWAPLCLWTMTCTRPRGQSYNFPPGMIHSFLFRRASGLRLIVLCVSRGRPGVWDRPGSSGAGPAAPLHEGCRSGRVGPGAALPAGGLQAHVRKEVVPTCKWTLNIPHSWMSRLAALRRASSSFPVAPPGGHGSDADSERALRVWCRRSSLTGLQNADSR